MSKPPREPEPGRHHPRNTLNDLTGRDWLKFTKSWFICDSRRYRRNQVAELHPARYPEELVTEFLQFFTKSGEWVLDPFCGSGATLIACREQGRNGVGLELAEKYAEISRSRLARTSGETAATVLQGDARRLSDLDLPQFDFAITSPPYWDMLHHPRGGVKSAHQQRIARGLDQVYSGEPGDLGNIRDYGEFLEALGQVFDGCRAVVKPGKYLTVVIQNVRAPSGEVLPLAWDLARRISQTWSFQGERIWCQNSKRLGIWGYPTTFVPNYHHHYCLIFRNSRPSG
ncbi:MAG TPA: DNA methyltransferase [Armatimonadota bacterium]|jgi:DNA modification methylase